MRDITCKYCGWSWDKNDGGDDIYVCHICNNDNSRFYDNITESEEPKKKLFIPRRLSGENSKWVQWNKEQPIKDGVQINQYTDDGIKTGYWEEYYPNGDIMSKGSYKDGKKDGIWEHYYFNGNIRYKGSYKNGERRGIWVGYYDNGNIKSKGSFKNGNREGLWGFYDNNGNLYLKELYKNGILVKKLPLTESEQPKKKLFIPRRVDDRYDDLLKSMITTNFDIESYLKRRDYYKDLKVNINPLVNKLSKDDLIKFVKANPFWMDSIDKVDFLLKTLTYKENKDIANNHIGQSFSKGNFYTTPELKYYEQKFKIPKSNYGKIDIYVFVGGDNYVEKENGSYEKELDIERLMKISLRDWRDTSDFNVGGMLKMMRMRASANNKTLYRIISYKGVLDKYNGKIGSEIPDYIKMAIDEKKEKI